MKNEAAATTAPTNAPTLSTADALQSRINAAYGNLLAAILPIAKPVHTIHDCGTGAIIWRSSWAKATVSVPTISANTYDFRFTR